MKTARRLMAILLSIVLMSTSLVGSFAYYDDYATASNTRLSNVCQQYVYQYDYYTGKYTTKNTLRMTINWSNVKSYSFNEENWYDNGNQSSRTFYIREDYYDKSPANGVEVVLPKSVNVLFLYIKEYGSNSIKVFQYKISSGDLSFLYGKNPVPTHIISVTDAIDALPTKANLKLQDEPKLISARNAFDALSVDKIWVYNAHKLYNLESRLDELKSAQIDWTTIYKDLVASTFGKLTEQYYDVPNKLYADLYVQADKTKIYQTKLGDPRYNNATISTDVLKDTTPNSTNVFFTYNFSHAATKGVYSPAMAKKVWGYFTPVETGKYQFKITSDDGHNWTMYLDDGTNLKEGFNILDYTKTVTTAFNLHDISDYTTSSYALKANMPYPLYIEYFNHGGNAALKIQYRIIRDNGTSTAWTDMQGNIFRPSSAYEFGFKAGNSAELLKLVTEGKSLVSTYNTPSKIGVTEGQVSQAALDALIAKVNEAQLALDNAIAGKLTQAQIDDAADKLRIAIENFKNAIVKKPNGISVPGVAQNGNFVTVSFNKDIAVNTYEIILSKDNAISADDKLYSLTNSNFNLGSNAQIGVSQGELSGLLIKNDSANGRYTFEIPLDAYLAQGSVNVFIRTATGENKGDASAFTLSILKQPTAFSYAVSDENVIFYTLDKVKDYGFAIDYYAPNAASMTRVYIIAKDKDYYVLPKSAVDLGRISSASLYRIGIVNNVQNYSGAHSVPKVGPTKVEIPVVDNLVVTIDDNQNYKLNWALFTGATGYELYVGDSADTSSMKKVDATISTNSFDLGKYSNEQVKYYAVRALINSDMYAMTGYSNVVKLVKPSAPDVLKKGLGTEVRTIVPTDDTRYVVKADGKTKGYYLVTMPLDYLKLTAVDKVIQNANGTYLVSFPEVTNQADEKYNSLGAVSFTTETNLDDQTKLVTYRIPYDETTDIALNIEALKHNLKTPSSQTISLVKYASDDGKTIYGISNATAVPMTVEINRPDIASDKSITGAVINGDAIMSILGDEFTITYKYHVNAKEVYNPNFVFELKENTYFGYDTPTVSGYYFDNGTQVELKNETVVTRDSVNKVTKVVVMYKGNPDLNLTDKDIFVTVKIKPQPNLSSNIMKLALSSGAVTSSSTAWELPYAVSKIKDANGIAVTEGLTIANSIEFDFVARSISAVKDSKTEPVIMKLKFTDKNKAKNSF